MEKTWYLWLWSTSFCPTLHWIVYGDVYTTTFHWSWLSQRSHPQMKIRKTQKYAKVTHVPYTCIDTHFVIQRPMWKRDTLALNGSDSYPMPEGLRLSKTSCLASTIMNLPGLRFKISWTANLLVVSCPIFTLLNGPQSSIWTFCRCRSFSPPRSLHFDANSKISIILRKFWTVYAITNPIFNTCSFVLPVLRVGFPYCNDLRQISSIYTTVPPSIWGTPSPTCHKPFPSLVN